MPARPRESGWIQAGWIPAYAGMSGAGEKKAAVSGRLFACVRARYFARASSRPSRLKRAFCSLLKDA